MNVQQELRVEAMVIARIVTGVSLVQNVGETLEPGKLGEIHF